MLFRLPVISPQYWFQQLWWLRPLHWLESFRGVSILLFYSDPSSSEKDPELKCHVRIVGSLWGQCSWFSDRPILLGTFPRALSLRQDLLFQRGQVHYSFSDMFHLHTWPLAGMLLWRKRSVELPFSSQRQGSSSTSVYNTMWKFVSVWYSSRQVDLLRPSAQR